MCIFGIAYFFNQNNPGIIENIKPILSKDINFEEIYILNILNNCQGHEVTAKEIAQQTHLKPYYLTKALQKLKDLGYLNKKRSDFDERTVIVFVNDQEKAKIRHTIEEVKKYFI